MIQRVDLSKYIVSNRIDWKKVIGKDIYFEYDDLKGYIKVLDYKEGRVTTNYNNIVKSIKACHFKAGHLGLVLGKITPDFKYSIGKNFKSDKADLTITGFKKVKGKQNYLKYYVCTCNICGCNEVLMLESNLEKNRGCGVCHGLRVVPGINDIPTTAPWMVKYFQGGEEEAKKYTYSASEKVYFKCPICGEIKKKALNIYTLFYNKHIYCKCDDSMSFPEKIMYTLLDYFKIKFENQYNPDWCKIFYNNKPKRFRYDFYFELNNKKYIVEMDGGWHKKQHYESKHSLEEIQLFDRKKDRLAESNGIAIIRIDCNKADYNSIINNIMISPLKNLFDFSSINFVSFQGLLYSNNLVKKICDIYNEDSLQTLLSITKKVHVAPMTVKQCLIKGSKLGWCKFSINNISSNAMKVKIRKRQKPMIVYTKDNAFHKHYESLKEVVLNSETIFGRKISNKCIRSHIKNNIPIDNFYLKRLEKQVY